MAGNERSCPSRRLAFVCYTALGLHPRWRPRILRASFAHPSRILRASFAHPSRILRASFAHPSRILRASFGRNRRKRMSLTHEKPAKSATLPHVGSPLTRVPAGGIVSLVGSPRGGVLKGLAGSASREDGERMSPE